MIVIVYAYKTFKNDDEISKKNCYLVVYDDVVKLR